MDTSTCEFLPIFRVIIALDRVCVKNNSITPISEVHALIRESCTEADIEIYMDVSTVHNQRCVFYSLMLSGSV